MLQSSGLVGGLFSAVVEGLCTASHLPCVIHITTCCVEFHRHGNPFNWNLITTSPDNTRILRCLKRRSKAIIWCPDWAKVDPEIRELIENGPYASCVKASFIGQGKNW